MTKFAWWVLSIASYYNSPKVVMFVWGVGCVGVGVGCVGVWGVFVFELLLHFWSDRHQIWTPGMYSRGSSMKHLGSKVAGDPRDQKC